MTRGPALLLTVLSSCSTAAPPAPGSPIATGVPAPAALPGPLGLSFAADFNPPRVPRGELPPVPEPSWDGALGGLSGLHYSAADSLLYAVCDDARRPPRLYTFAVELGESTLRVSPRAVITLREPQPTGVLLHLDAESITGSAGGSFWIGTENRDEHATQRWPRIASVDPSGLITGTLPLPEAFLPELEGEPTRGPRANLAFEGLALSPAGRWLTAITETSLRQDGPLADLEHGTTTRLLQWDLQHSAAATEYRYQTEPAARVASVPSPAVVLNGVAELVSLDEERLLVLERAYVAQAAGGGGVNTVRIFEIRRPAGTATGSSTFGAPPPLLDKRLILDLDQVIDRLEPGHQRLDNFEGMTRGPRFPSGAQSLLLVSDDNFSERQRTVFLALRIEGAGSGGK
jgi:hypothetical protein